MAERVKEQLILEHGADLVAGPDAYLDLPNLIRAAGLGKKRLMWNFRPLKRIGKYYPQVGELPGFGFYFHHAGLR